jgi:hypothetical protein
MKTKIYHILHDLLAERIYLEEAIADILYLFSVSKRFNFPNFMAGFMVGMMICIFIYVLVVF